MDKASELELEAVTDEDIRPAAEDDTEEKQGENEAVDESGTSELRHDAPVAEVAKPKSWASLFHSKATAVAAKDGDAKPMAMVSPFTDGTDVDRKDREEEDGEGQAFNPLAEEKDSELVTYMANYALKHKSASLKPRGLSNRSNWCFVNAILQSLTACPPFYNFISSLPLAADIRPSSPTPAGAAATGSKKQQRWVILRSVWEFLRSMEAMPSFPKLNRKCNKQSKDDLPLGATIEATSVYNMLLEHNSDKFKVIEGRQEDAEEFLTFLLNGLDDEAVAIKKFSAVDKKQQMAGGGVREETSDAEDWKEVGPKNRGVVTRRVLDQPAGSAKTPIASIFQGQIRSTVQHSGGEATATLQPFFTLQLDIQSESVHSVSDALGVNFSTEALENYVCSATKKEVDASRSVALEELPPILVLHLKRFVYDESSGGCQKLLKAVDFPVDLEIRREILSTTAARAYKGLKERQYKLFAAVYHSGAEATKGHYVADVYHTGLASWLRCDDSSVRAVNESAVLNPAHHNSSPYILFYRRLGLQQAA